MQFDQNEYKATLDKLVAMREQILDIFSKDRLRSFGLVVSDSTGIVIDQREPHEQDEPVIRVDLLEGTVKLSGYNATRNIHERLVEMGVPHDYKLYDAATETPAALTLSLADALLHLGKASARRFPRIGEGQVL